MQFVDRVRAVWSWLPAFRAVAETEHLPSAAQELGVVPSSLSRSVKLLEDELGVVLFDRSGKALVLNDAGRALLVAVRDAMRLVDESLCTAGSDELRGNVGAVASSDFVRTLVVPACALLANEHPAVCVHALMIADDSVVATLLRGDADVAITVQPPDRPELRTSELAVWTRAAYASSAVTGEPAHIVVGTPAVHRDDGWPIASERAVAAWASDEYAALAMCARTTLVTVAFDVIARASGHAGVRRLDSPRISPRAIYLVHRRAIGTHRRTDALVSAIRGVAARLTTA